jgi:DNA ligase (NAD+)
MTQKEYNELLNKLIAYSDSYYNEHISLITDKEFDILLKELEDIEEAHPEWVREDSLTKRPGISVMGEKQKHGRPMLSLQNTYNKEEIEEWYNKMVKDFGVKDFITEYKYDGVSFSAIYENGKIVKGLTRGDGEYGEDITQNLKLINDLQLDLTKRFSGEVRGEIIMEKSEFERINISGNYANPRNLTSGTLKLLDVERFKERKLRAFVYWLEDAKYPTHKDCLNHLSNEGFNVGEYYVANDFSTLWDNILAIEKNKKSVDYDIDGAVIKVNQRDLWGKIGGTSKFPHWAKAYKYEPDTMITTVKDVEFWVGRTGKITPVAILEPVFLAGSTVQKATLNNKVYMENLDIQIGDKVDIKKAAEIIPFINHVVKDLRLTDGQTRTKVTFPTHCPECGTKLKKLNDEHQDYYCTNDDCPARIVGKIVKFTTDMEIDGFAEIMVEKLYNAGFLCSFEDLYNLKTHREEILQLDRMGDKLIDRLLKNIEDSKTQKLEKFIASLGIWNVGKSVGKALVKEFGTLKLIMGAGKEELLAMDDVGDTIANAIYDYFRNPANKKMIQTLIDNYGLNLQEGDISQKVDALSLDGKNFCITGALSLKRDDYIELIENLGGKVVGSVSKNTHYLITNDKTTGTSKNIKARELGVPIINEEEMLTMCDSLHLLKTLNSN